MDKKVYIYSLEYPEGNVRYIGQSVDPKKRFSVHCRDESVTHKTCWIKSLKEKGVKPIMKVIDTVPEDQWSFWEIHYISLYRSFGFVLTNSSFGGEGMSPTEATRKKQIENCSRRKPVLQFDMSGSFIREWECAWYVRMELGYYESGVGTSCNNGIRSYKDFIWLWKADYDKDPSVLQNRLEALKIPLGEMNPNKRIVLQFHQDGTFIQEWDSPRRVQDVLGIDMGGIAKCCRGDQKQTGGYIWKFKDGSEGKQFSFTMSEERKQKIAKEKFGLHGGKIIRQYTLQGEFVKEWSQSACSIAKELGMYKNADILIRNSLKGINNCAKGFIWIWKETLENNPNEIQDRINRSRKLGKANKL